MLFAIDAGADVLHNHGSGPSHLWNVTGRGLPMPDADSTWIALGVLVGIPLYFLPSVIAGVRGHKNFTALFALNLFLGWLLIGWVVSLVWSLLADQERERRRRRRFVEDYDDD